MEDKFVYCVYEDYHGLVGIWDDEIKARAEVDRINKMYDDPEECGYWHHGEHYGTDDCHYVKTKINVPW